MTDTVAGAARRAARSRSLQISADLNPSLTPQSAGDPARTSACGARHGQNVQAGEHELLTVEETAEMLHISRDQTYHLIRTGQLHSIKIGKLRRISRARIAQFIARLETAGS